MEYKVLSSGKKLCASCMKEHNVKTILIPDCLTFKDKKICYEAIYTYCDIADEMYENEDQIQRNDIVMKDAYRKSEGLLTSKEIGKIRSLYGISQSDLCTVLGWGIKTITRYETHQVQDKAHDTILKKIGSDPEWFISLLKEAKDNLSEIAYQKYMALAMSLYKADQDMYLRKSIEASYAGLQENALYNGNTKLSLDKVVDVIRYFASSKDVTNLYKVKLMKLMWYADALSYKKRCFAITGLIYRALPMGAVPIAHEFIIDLEGVPCEEEDMGETNAYHFYSDGKQQYLSLTTGDMDILDEVILRLGHMSKAEIVEFMHREQAYIKTSPRDIILFKYAMYLQI